jgi:diguanylate cyclase (GGDEF)-like protein
MLLQQAILSLRSQFQGHARKASRFSAGKMIPTAVGLFIVQAAALAIFGQRPVGVLLSEVVQLLIGTLCIAASVQAFRHSTSVARYYWRWLAVTFSVWAIAQGLGVYIDLSSNGSLEALDGLLFYLSVIPFGMLIFLDPENEPRHFDRLHLLDFLQVCIFWFAILLYFAPQVQPGTQGLFMGFFGGTRALAFDGMLTMTFALRAVLTESVLIRRFFGRMAVFLMLSGLADCYADNLGPGQWFDLVWSVLLGIPLVIAATWERSEAVSESASERAHAVVIHQFFPLLYPFFSLLLLLQLAARAKVIAVASVMTSFVALGIRVLIIQHRLVHAQAALEFEATHDFLTGLWNRGVVIESLQKELQRSERSGDSLGVILADLDHFKGVNDTFGHLTGDLVLQEVARRLVASVRSYDWLGRYGGEEFLAVIPNCNADEIVASGERLRQRIAESPIPTAAGPIAVTLSVGVVSAALDQGPPNYMALLRMADAALYRAKCSGRNRVESARFESESTPAAAMAAGSSRSLSD